jgi:predicted RNA-binding Zn ribbon-like protein
VKKDGPAAHATHIFVVPEQDHTWIAMGEDETALLARVHDALLEGTWPRLRACRKATCRYAYYDRTKNASRAWCSMATCGNQAKAQRRRHRERPH